MPISAMDCITLAFEHTKRQLFKPFRFGQWVRLAIVGLLAGELGSGGNLNLQSPPAQPQSGPQIPAIADIFHKIDPAILASVITVLVITGLVLLILMAFVSSVMRFVLFDSVLTRECHIRAGWSRRQDNGWKYFLWQMGLILATFAAAVVLMSATRPDRSNNCWTDGSVFILPQMVCHWRSLIERNIARFTRSVWMPSARLQAGGQFPSSALKKTSA